MRMFCIKIVSLHSINNDIMNIKNIHLAYYSGKRLRVYTLPFIVKVLTFAP